MEMRRRRKGSGRGGKADDSYRTGGDSHMDLAGLARFLIVPKRRGT